MGEALAPSTGAWRGLGHQGTAIRFQGHQQPKDPAPQTERVPGGWRGHRGAGQDEGSPMNVAVCPCRPVPPGSVAPDGGQTGGHHIFTTRRRDSESPLSPSDQHRQHPGACHSVVIEPGLRTSQREGHGPKSKGPRARVGLWPSHPNALLGLSSAPGPPTGGLQGASW